MSELKGAVHYETRGNIAVMTIDNPPVNPLSSGVRQGLHDGVSAALSDDAIAAVVLTGNGRAFIAGADISEFGNAVTSVPSLGDVLDMMEGSPKPIVAAINGTAFGGGRRTCGSARSQTWLVTRCRRHATPAQTHRRGKSTRLYTLG